MRKLSAAFIAGTLFVVASLPAAAGEIGIEVGFSDREISTIQAYYRDHDSAARGGNSKAGKGGKGLTDQY